MIFIPLMTHFLLLQTNLFDMLMMTLGITFGENHFKAFKDAGKGKIVRAIWLIATTLLVLSYQQNLKVILT